MKTVTGSLSTHLAQEVTALSTCWTITRVDGKVFRFTDCDTDILKNGLTYQAIGAYKRSAISATSSLSVDNLEVVGATNALVLPEDELRTGLFDGAEVTIEVASWQEEVTGEIKMRRGFFGEVVVLPNGTYTVELRGMLQRLSHTYTNIYTPTCSVDLGSTECGIPLVPADVARDTAYTIATTSAHASYVRAPLSAAQSGTYTKLPISDPGFETVGTLTGGFASSTAWIPVAGSPAATTAQKKTGTYSHVGGSGGSTITQLVDLIFTTGLSPTAIDGGNAVLNMYGWRLDTTGTATLTVRYLDINQTEISAAGIGTGGDNVGTTWTLKSLTNATIPANTRYIRIDYVATSVGNYLDAVFGYVVDRTGTTFLSESYGNFYYECTTAGTTAATAPAYGGATVTDGTAVFTRREAWTRSGMVTDNDDNRVMRVQITEPRAVDAWFDDGTVTFETGKNAGISMEVKTWTQADGQIELFLSMPNQVEPGDLFRVYPGCDKTRIACAAIFLNVVNFRGFPDVPGQDNLYLYPDAKT